MRPSEKRPRNLGFYLVVFFPSLFSLLMIGVLVMSQNEQDLIETKRQPGMDEEVPEEDRLFRFVCTHNEQDPLGAPVGSDNAAFIMSAHVRGPDLLRLLVGESQIRQACTADSHTRHEGRVIAIEYRVERIK